MDEGRASSRRAAEEDLPAEAGELNGRGRGNARTPPGAGWLRRRLETRRTSKPGLDDEPSRRGRRRLRQSQCAALARGSQIARTPRCAFSLPTFPPRLSTDHGDALIIGRGHRGRQCLRGLLWQLAESVRTKSTQADGRVTVPNHASELTASGRLEPGSISVESPAFGDVSVCRSRRRNRQRKCRCRLRSWPKWRSASPLDDFIGIVTPPEANAKLPAMANRRSPDRHSVGVRHGCHSCQSHAGQAGFRDLAVASQCRRGRQTDHRERERGGVS